MVGQRPAATPPTLTYKQAAVVQPFANTLVNMKMTGAQIKTRARAAVAARQQGCRPDPAVPAARHVRGLLRHLRRRPGPRATASPACGSTARPIDAGDAYSVTVNSFLASGGDNFRGFNARHRQARHRQGRPAGHGRLHGDASPQDAARGRTSTSARWASRWPADAPRVLPHRPGRQAQPVLARDDRRRRRQGRLAQHQGRRRDARPDAGRQHASAPTPFDE